jgi:hypothetical protein
MKTFNNPDYKVIDQLRWSPPSEFITHVEIEDDESSAYTNYEQILTDEFCEVAIMMYGGVVPEKHCNQDWHIRFLEVLNSIIGEGSGWKLQDVREAISEWVSEINSAVQKSAESGFEDRVSGDHWGDINNMYGGDD